MCSPIWYRSVSPKNLEMRTMMLATFVSSAFRLQLAESLPVFLTRTQGWGSNHWDVCQDKVKANASDLEFFCYTAFMKEL